MALTYCGPICQVAGRSREPNDPGTLIVGKHAPPGPTGKRRRHHRAHKRPVRLPPVDVVVYNQDKLAREFLAVARTVVLARRASPVEVKSSRFEHFLAPTADGYQGALDLGFGDEKKINDAQLAECRRLIDEFAKRLERGPESAEKFRQEQRNAHAQAVEQLHDFRDWILKSNADVRREYAIYTKVAVVEKLGATIIWKVGGMFTGGVGMFLADLGYDGILNICTEAEKAKDAHVVLSVSEGAAMDFVEERSKQVADDVIDKVTEYVEEKFITLMPRGLFQSHPMIDKLARKGIDVISHTRVPSQTLGATSLAYRALPAAGETLRGGLKVLWCYKNVKAAIETAKAEWKMVNEEE